MPERHDIVPMYPQSQQMMPRAPQSLGPPLPSDAPEPSIIRPILRHWWLIVVFVVICVSAALVYIKTATPLFTSTAKIYIQPTSGDVSAAIGDIERENYLSTQLQVIQSTRILDRVAIADGMRDMKTFAKADGKIVFFLANTLDIQLERKTDLIDISLSTPYPDESAQIVAAVVAAYNDYCLEEKNDRSHSLLKSLKDNLAQEDKTM